MIKMSRKAKKAMAVALTAGMLASTATTPVMAANAGWKQNSTGWWYENADGTYPANKWEKINGSWYYFDAKGYMVTDWKQIGGKWYYFGGANDGAMKDGWFQDATGQWCYAVPGNGAITQDGWAKDAAGNWYYLKANGYMQAGGWAKTGNHWYFLRNDGVMQTGIIDVDGEVFYLNEDGDMFVGEKTIDGVTYTFDAYGKAVGDKIPTATKAFKKDGTPVALAPEERELSVTSVTAITKNANGDFVVTALLSEEVTADTLKDTTLTLKNGSIVVTAKFDSVSGATAVYKIADASKLTPQDSSADGSYAVTSNNIDVATGLTAAYEETLVGNAVQGIVYYKKGTNEYVPIQNATVKVGNKTVTTDVYGYYSISASSGIATVEVSASNYFGKTAETKVSRNYPSAQNIELEKYDQEKLFINGIVAADTADGKGVQSAKVELQKKGTDGKYTTIATVYTPAGGAYVFGNSEADFSSIGSDTPSINTDGIFVFEDSDDNKLSEKNTYKVVISKDYNATGNLYDAYKKAEYDVAMSQTGAQTNMNTKAITPIKKITDATISLSWDKEIKVSSPATVTVNFMDTDGKTVLGTADASYASLVVTDNALEENINLIKSGVFEGQNPTLPTGTYALVISDGTNATKVIAVDVTEGGKIIASGEIEKATEGTITTSVNGLKYTTAVKTAYKNGKGGDAVVITAVDGSELGSDPVSITYDVYEKVSDTLKVKVDNKVSGFKYSYEGGKTTNSVDIAATTSLTGLEAGKEYVCVPTGSNIGSASSLTVSNAAIDASFKETPTVTSAAKVEKINISGVDFRNADGTTVTTPVTNVKVLSVKIKDEKGNVVKEVSNPKKTDASVANDIEIANVFNDDVKLTGIAPGKYTAEISLDGYETFTTDAFELIDFHAATITTKATVKAIAKTTLSGSLRYEDGTAVSEDASIVVYDANGVVVAAKKYTSGDAGIFNIVNGTDATLGAGTYKVVVRGKGFETYATGIELKANDTTSLQIKVTKHVGGQVKLAVRDENNYGYGETTGIVLYDEYYVDPTNDTLDKYNYLDNVLGSSTANYIGKFAATKMSDVEYTTTTGGKDYLSKGNYTIWIEGTDRAYGNAGKDTVTIASANATAYKNIVLKSKSSKKTIPLTVTFTGVKNQVDWVVIENIDGTIVAADDDILDAVDSKVAAGKVTFNVNSNATYVVKVYAKDKFVGSTQVTIQDFAKTTSVSLNDAERS